MYFRQFWQDPRLAFQARPGLEKLVVGAEYIKLIWVPDTFFVNEKTAYFHSACIRHGARRIADMSCHVQRLSAGPCRLEASCAVLEGHRFLALLAVRGLEHDSEARRRLAHLPNH